MRGVVRGRKGAGRGEGASVGFHEFVSRGRDTHGHPESARKDEEDETTATRPSREGIGGNGSR